jgi:hypothetical protein
LKNCQYLEDGCHLCLEYGYFRRNFPNRAHAQSQQHSITIDRPIKEYIQLAQSGASMSRGRGRGQSRLDKTPGRVYHLNQQTARASTEVVADMTLIDGFKGYVLICPGATHSFIA